MESLSTKTAPNPKERHWLLGNMAGMINDPLNYLRRVQEHEGNLVHLASALGEMYVVYDPEGIKYILQENNRNYIKGNFIKILKPLLGNGLVTNEGDFWKKQRRLIQPAFNKERYGEMIQTIVECVEDLMKEWRQYPDGSTVNICKEMNKLALRVVAKALFKTDIEADIPIVNQNLVYVLRRVFKRFGNPVLYADWLPTPANFKERKSIKQLEAIVVSIIEAKRNGDIEKSGDILDMMMEVQDEETSEKMSIQQLRDEIITLILAGHETTANAMSFMWHELASSPEIFSKVVAEADAIAREGQLRVESLRKIVYIKQVVNETLRLYPPGSLIQRRTIEDDVVCGYSIPKKKDVLLPIFAVHRMKTYWDQPDKFDPERFETEKVKALPRFAFFPFGGGQRLCIGDQFAIYEMMIALLLISREYTFEVVNKEPVQLELSMALRPKNDILLRIYRH